MGRFLLLGAVLFFTAGCSKEEGVFSIVNNFSVFSQVRVGDQHSCATKDGKTKCWGLNNGGQLGDYSGTNSVNPVEVFNLPMRAVGVSTGFGFSCASVGNSVSCWGNNNFNQQNVAGAASNLAVPTGVTGVRMFKSGADFSCALTATAVRCWGRNDFGQTGTGAVGGTTFAPASTPTLAGVAVATGTLAHLGVGLRHACIVKDGGVQCWGDNAAGQIGTGTAGGTVAAPTVVTAFGSDVGATQVAAGSDHTCSVSRGEVYCWGSNDAGQLGTGDNTNQLKPTKVVGLGKGEVAQLVAGDKNTCVVTTGGALKCWGLNDQGQLGNASIENKTTPTDVSGMGSGVRSIAPAINKHACAVQGDSLKCWGLNTNGQLGDGTSENRLAPVNVNF